MWSVGYFPCTFFLLRNVGNALIKNDAKLVGTLFTALQHCLYLPLHRCLWCFLDACWSGQSLDWGQSPSGHTSGSRSPSAVWPDPCDQQAGRCEHRGPECPAGNTLDGPKKPTRTDSKHPVVLTNTFWCPKLTSIISLWINDELIWI